MKTPSRTTCNTADADIGASARELVVVLHGLGVTHHAMGRIARALAGAGYNVASATYPSRSMPLERIASEWLPGLLDRHNAGAARRAHFVTHSLGGIVVQLWLREKGAPTNIGRVVMIAPPNQGSEVPDHFRGRGSALRALFRLVAGANASRLGTDDGSAPRSLSRGEFPAGVELGVIAGNRWVNPFFLPWFEGESDGTVSVASTRLAGMRDHIVMPHSHTGLIMRRAVAEQALHFLREGKFQHGANRGKPA
jgi:predicted alpha/beta hydrolase family esterase